MTTESSSDSKERLLEANRARVREIWSSLAKERETFIASAALAPNKHNFQFPGDITQKPAKPALKNLWNMVRRAVKSLRKRRRGL